MLNFDITELLTDGRMNGQTNGKADAYVAMSEGQEMFRARFDGCS